MALDYKSGLVRYRKYLQQTQERPMVRASVFVIFSLVLVIVMLVFALKPTLVTIAGLLGQLKSHGEISEQLGSKILAIQQAGALLEQNRERLKLLDEALPRTGEWVSWVKSTQETATKSGVMIRNFVIGPVQVVGKEVRTAKEERAEGMLVWPQGLGGVDFSLTVEGEYAVLKQFLDTLEQSRRIILLSDVQFTKEVDGGLNLTLKGALGFVANPPNL